MRLGGLPEQIETLVNHLRKREADSLSLTDVAAVTEVLLRTMDSYFKSVDLNLYQECQNLTDYISNARKEIAALQPENLESARIPRAGKELDAIVKQTEEATNTIMEAAEEIMATDTADMQAYQQTVNDAIMRIFEACSFQDITGQRISKVVETLTYIETRARELKTLLDVDGSVFPDEEEGPVDEDATLLHGPALEGEGIDQNEVDVLMDTDVADTDKTTETKTIPEKPTEKKAAAKKSVSKKPVAKKTVAKTAPPAKLNGSSTGKAKAAPDTVEKLELPADTDGRTTQDDIDALFS